MVGERRQQRRRHERLLDPVGLHRAQHRLEVEARQRHDRAAVRQRVVEHAGQAHAVEEGREAEHALPLLDRERHGHLHEVGHQRAMGELDRLRQPGRTARGEHDRDLAGIGPRLRRRASGGHQLTERRLAEHDHVVDTGLHGRLAGDRGQRADGDQDPGARAPQLACELSGGEERARRRHRTAGAQAAVQDHRELGEVREVQPEHVAAAEPAGGEADGHTLDAAGELAVGDRPPARAVDHRRVTGEAAGVAQHERAEVEVGDLGLRPRAAHHPLLDRRWLFPKRRHDTTS